MVWKQKARFKLMKSCQLCPNYIDDITKICSICKLFAVFVKITFAFNINKKRNCLFE